ncbi:M10 family metallopeptidase C-terminal domain-containing protein [Pseudomonas salomonii]|uniref:Peptidase n=1 Tax=Pseudomonas salomonii TaxID=191391 RepID=A0ABS9GRY5_9PSED|nr:M10 family metallopeptidase C-terminal domain-containing protein [Pseudomonas salomonii]MCF5547143.1 peptidase [Pseudomonas salomonii]
MSTIRSYTPALLNLGAAPTPPDQPPASQVQNPQTSSVSDKVGKDLTREKFKISDNNGDGKITVAYNFADLSKPENAWRKKNGASEFSEERKNAFRESIRAWGDVVNVTFTENTKDADVVISVHGNPGVGGYASMPVGDARDMSIGIGVGDKNLPLNSSMIHEIGHSLGLGHPEGNYPQNNKTHTAMSYSTHWWRPRDERGVSISDSTSTPMMGDIAAGQSLYGANNKTRTGDTTYGFNSNAERSYYSLKNADDLTAFCVWDNGGNDTLDFSGYKQNQKINLNAESLSDVGNRKGNVSIAKGVVVENAVGGSGNDQLIGNDVSNRLTGGAGGDTLLGGGGADTFVYNKASDSSPGNPDKLNDFVSGVDKIDLSSLLKEAGIAKPIITGVHTDQAGKMPGKKGELLLDYDKKTQMHRLTLDVSGDGKSTLMILSKTPIKPDDIVTHSDAPPPVVAPGPKPAPSPEPQPEPTPAPAPAPAPAPKPKPHPEPKPKPNPTPPPSPQCDKDNTVYGFNSNTGNPATSLTSSCDKPAFSVSDQRGNDTFDFSRFKQDQRINLTPGSHSSVGGLVDNVHITTGTVIENAIGGKGNDRIIGNSADNSLTGGAGADTLKGNGGFNTFNYHAMNDSPRDNADLITDFISGQDKIDLSKMSQNINVTFNAVDQYTGRAGDTVLGYNQAAKRYFLAIDMTGNGKSDFVIKSTAPISREDVIGLTLQKDGYL